MSHLSEMQRAIDFIEEHLLSGVTYTDAARHLFMSGYHFHRLFSAAAGLTVSEYIRKRKLSLAAQELLSSDVRIIDLALKYGYESPESFSKAFSKFHGQSPASVRRNEGCSVRIFDRIRISNQQGGIVSMEYRIAETEGCSQGSGSCCN